MVIIETEACGSVEMQGSGGCVCSGATRLLGGIPFHLPPQAGVFCEGFLSYLKLCVMSSIIYLCHLLAHCGFSQFHQPPTL